MKELRTEYCILNNCHISLCRQTKSYLVSSQHPNKELPFSPKQFADPLVRSVEGSGLIGFI